jgi:hypothetical protein
VANCTLNVALGRPVGKYPDETDGGSRMIQWGVLKSWGQWPRGSARLRYVFEFEIVEPDDL